VAPEGVKVGFLRWGEGEGEGEGGGGREGGREGGCLRWGGGG